MCMCVSGSVHAEMADINAIADQIDGLTLLEASQLVKMLEQEQ